MPKLSHAKLECHLYSAADRLRQEGPDENGELRDPVAYPEQFKDSPLGRIPQEWEVIPVEEVEASR